jgi:hypothetical protein
MKEAIKLLGELGSRYHKSGKMVEHKAIMHAMALLRKAGPKPRAKLAVVQPAIVYETASVEPTGIRTVWITSAYPGIKKGKVA